MRLISRIFNDLLNYWKKTHAKWKVISVLQNYTLLILKIGPDFT